MLVILGERAAHSAYDMFSLYNILDCHSVVCFFFPSRLLLWAFAYFYVLVWVFGSDCTNSCLLLAFIFSLQFFII